MYNTLINSNNSKQSKEREVFRKMLGLKPRFIDDYIPVWHGHRSDMIYRLHAMNKRVYNIKPIQAIVLVLALILSAYNW